MIRGENFTFFEKYTTVLYNGGTAYTFYSDPWEVLPFNEITVEVFVAGMTATSAFWVDLQESNDLKEWTAMGGSGTAQLTSPGTEAVLTASNTARWVRLILRDFSGTTVPAYHVLWAKGVARNA